MTDERWGLLDQIKEKCRQYNRKPGSPPSSPKQTSSSSWCLRSVWAIRKVCESRWPGLTDARGENGISHCLDDGLDTW